MLRHLEQQLNMCFKISFLAIIFLGNSVFIATGYNTETYKGQSHTCINDGQTKNRIWTTSSGVAVNLENTHSLNSNLILNSLFLEHMSHFNRERIPERVVHAKGHGAFGYFKVTQDLAKICKAKVFDTVGKITKVAVRFSPFLERAGTTDTTRGTRGFAIKLYTEQGNLDLTALNLEMFLLKDPILFPTLVHTTNKNPSSQLLDENTIWDFITLNPVSLNGLMRTFGDRGIPDGVRHMPGFTIHTFELINHRGERTYARFHILPDAGIKHLTSEQAIKIQGQDSDYATRDLYNAIANGTFPTWTISIQTIPFKKLKYINFDIFDVTIFWPLADFPREEIGKLVLNRNPKNSFAEIEQLAFNPGNLVPGLRGVDKLFQARMYSYIDAQNYRLGPNFNKIHVNCPLGTVAWTYNRDGSPPVLDNGKDDPNYFPNSFFGPRPCLESNPPMLVVYTNPNVTNFDQASFLYEHDMSAGEKCRFVDNILTSLRPAKSFLQERAVKLYKQINIKLGESIESGLRTNATRSC